MIIMRIRILINITFFLSISFAEAFLKLLPLALYKKKK